MSPRRRQGLGLQRRGDAPAFHDGEIPFRYRIFSVLLDIDGIEQAAASTRLFSLNRFNLLSFHVADHLPPGETDLRAWAERVLAGGGIDGSRLRSACCVFRGCSAGSSIR